MWGLVAIAGIAWLAYTAYLDHQRKTARTGGGGVALRSLESRLDAVEAERDRLRARIETLEAIVTDDGFVPSHEAGRLDLDALGEAPDATSEATRRGRTRA